MFAELDYQYISPDYFTIYDLSRCTIYVESKNTLDRWLLISAETKVVCHHCHNQNTWHFQRKIHSVEQAIRHIKSHDTYILNGRRQSYDRIPSDEVYFKI